MAFAVCTVLPARDPATGSRCRRAGRHDVAARVVVLGERRSRCRVTVRSAIAARVRVRPFDVPAAVGPVARRLRCRPAGAVPLGLQRISARTPTGAGCIAGPAPVPVAPGRSVSAAVRRTTTAGFRLGPPRRALARGGSAPRRIVTAPPLTPRAALTGDRVTARTRLRRRVFGTPWRTRTAAHTRVGCRATLGLPPGSRHCSGASGTIRADIRARGPPRPPTTIRRHGDVRSGTLALLASRSPTRRSQRHVVPIGRCTTVFRAGQARRVGLDSPLVVVGRARARPGLDRILRIHHPFAVARWFAPVANRRLVLTCHLRSPRQCLGNTRVFRQDHPAAE